MQFMSRFFFYLQKYYHSELWVTRLSLSLQVVQNCQIVSRLVMETQLCAIIRKLHHIISRQNMRIQLQYYSLHNKTNWVTGLFFLLYTYMYSKRIIKMNLSELSLLMSDLFTLNVAKLEKRIWQKYSVFFLGKIQLYLLFTHDTLEICTFNI